MRGPYPPRVLRVAVILLLCLAAAGAARASSRAAQCTGLANELASTRGARQLLTVVAPSTASTGGELTLWARGTRCWRAVAGPWPARLGRDGLSAHHREGDGTTPAGAYGIGATMYGVAADPGVAYRYHRLVCGDWWDEDPATADYNRFVHVACGTRPRFGGGSEALWLETAAYVHFAVIAYNASPVVPGRGSAIFLHADVGAPTNGCVSLPLPELDAVLRALRPADSPLVVIGTAASIRSY